MAKIKGDRKMTVTFTIHDDGEEYRFTFNWLEFLAVMCQHQAGQMNAMNKIVKSTVKRMAGGGVDTPPR